MPAENKGMHVAFRTDASLDIGTGHVMRCLTLADALRQRGAQCHFICREHRGNLVSRIAGQGFAVSVLPAAEPSSSSLSPSASAPAHASWLGGDWRDDACGTADVLAKFHANWLVVDHYALDRQWEASLTRRFENLLVIDDLADRPHTCDVLLDPNLGREAIEYAGLVPSDCMILVGPDYALLRPEFAALREYSLHRRRGLGQVRHVVVTMGGVDSPNATGTVLGSLAWSALPRDCRVTVILGERAPWLREVRAAASALPWPVEVRVNVTDMARVMADSDLAIGAAGSTAWERCCLGLPSILVSLAANQELIARSLDAQGAAVNAGAITDPGFPGALARALHDLAGDIARLRSMADSAAAVTRGAGVDNAVRAMTQRVH